jgi:hypothetical protein
MMKSAILKRIFLGCSAIVFSVLVGYGQEGSPDALTGTWTKTVNGRVMTFTISSDLTYQVEFAGNAEIDVYGDCVISGTQVTFNDKGGAYRGDVPGTYAFQVKDKSVTFTVVDDPLPGRRMLVEGQWSGADTPE